MWLELFYEKLSERLDREDFVSKIEKEIYAEWLIEDELSVRFCKEINKLEPFGLGNKKPLFATTEYKVVSTPLKMGSPHYSFRTKVVEMLDFNGKDNVLSLILPMKKTLVFEPNYSVFKGR